MSRAPRRGAEPRTVTVKYSITEPTDEEFQDGDLWYDGTHTYRRVYNTWVMVSIGLSEEARNPNNSNDIAATIAAQGLVDSRTTTSTYTHMGYIPTSTGMNVSSTPVYNWDGQTVTIGGIGRIRVPTTVSPADGVVIDPFTGMISSEDLTGDPITLLLQRMNELMGEVKKLREKVESIDENVKQLYE